MLVPYACHEKRLRMTSIGKLWHLKKISFHVLFVQAREYHPNIQQFSNYRLEMMPILEKLPLCRRQDTSEGSRLPHYNTWQNILRDCVVRPTAGSCAVFGVHRESQCHLLLLPLKNCFRLLPVPVRACMSECGMPAECSSMDVPVALGKAMSSVPALRCCGLLRASSV